MHGQWLVALAALLPTRAGAVNVCTCPNGTPTVDASVGGSGATLCEQHANHDCSACTAGWTLSAPAGTGPQRCDVSTFTCTCTNGVAAVGGGAGGCATNIADCASCNGGYHMSAAAGAGSQSCVANTCTCPNGTPTVATGSGATLCEVHNTVDCSACGAGYSIRSAAGRTSSGGVGAHSCQPNVCYCEEGTAAVASGTGATLCEAHSNVDCSACAAGYHPSATPAAGTQTCLPNVCTCPNGVPAMYSGVGGTLCEVHNAVDCSACAAGYHPSAIPAAGLQTCQQNSCSCPQGTAAVFDGSGVTLCEIHSAEDCSACSAGYSRSLVVSNGVQTGRATCVQLSCTCPNGTPTVATGDGGSGSTLCEANANVDCSACDAGYHLSQTAGVGTQTCEKNRCSCLDGTATLFSGSGGTLCGAHGAVDCSACFRGYSLSAPAGAGAQTCSAVSCTCPNGTPAIAAGSGGGGATLCEANSNVDCSACASGYHSSSTPGLGLPLTTCVANVCSCPNGTPTVSSGTGGTLCETHSAVDCSACNTGYSLSAPAGAGAQTCSAVSCTCPNGTPAIAAGSGGGGATLCEANSNVDCSACASGYHSSSTPGLGLPLTTCVANVCSCPNGVATTSHGSGATFCAVHDTEDCSSCVCPRACACAALTVMLLRTGSYVTHPLC
jgi:hypothetical protein